MESPGQPSNDDQPNKPEREQVNREENEVRCTICLSELIDKTIISPCYHAQYCFRCVLTWTQLSRRCPLCCGPIEYLLHNLSSQADHERYYPLPLLPPHQPPSNSRAGQRSSSARRTVPAARLQEIREEERARFALDRRRYVYRHSLYAKHIAANPSTRFRPISTRTFNRDQAAFKARATSFLRRELCVFDGLVGGVEERIGYIIQILLSLDCKSEGAIRLFSEFIGGLDLAEHFAHELSCFLRSPYHDVRLWDSIVQYDRPSPLGLQSPSDRVSSITRPRLIPGSQASGSRHQDSPAFLGGKQATPRQFSSAAQPEPLGGTPASVQPSTSSSRKRLRKITSSDDQLPKQIQPPPALLSKNVKAGAHEINTATDHLGNLENIISPAHQSALIKNLSILPTDSGSPSSSTPVPSSSSHPLPCETHTFSDNHITLSGPSTATSLNSPSGPDVRGELDQIERLLKLKVKLSLRRKHAQ
ncbi:hypothetical protein CROQUDRAFT_58027 [Cronartium quercuum f. sp. fusiforme G11]|uniref:RING-type E3 ubiquitin transferase n=1 Tax=Cronartium quercuum f. sp. fusiforme G11 TaxID=708437 RepID=A0A9P6TFP1_9BASI|nr:hypothetical protein CROQUDRAFT_58027 [Cronartium quercuum f. sp. fusiforme G11]